jgi:mannose-6-phosphate isomerase-like protein (cupin superfamily)
VSSAPEFGRLLAPLLGDLSPAVLPAFLARLERTAADRYRSWAQALPAWAGELLQCADAEDEIADRIIAAFPISADDAAMLEARLPDARTIYYDAFAGLSPVEQLEMQAAAERQGANAWRSVAARNPGLSNEVGAVLASCSALEEASADRVDALLARPTPSASGATAAGLVTHESARMLEGWTTASGERLTWRTLMSGDRDPSRSFAAGVTEIPASPDGVVVHRHALDELYFIVSGAGSVIIDGVEHAISAGSTVFVPGSSWHGVRNPGPEPVRLFYVFPTTSFTDVVYEYPEGAPLPVWD